MATTRDCIVLGDFYGTPELRAVSDSRALVQAWLDVESTLAAEDSDVTTHLAQAELERLLDPAGYLGLAPLSAQAVAGRLGAAP